MHLLGRQAARADFPEAYNLISDRFLYENGEPDALFDMWQEIIDGESGYASVVAAFEQRPVLAFGISVALKPEFLENALADPQPFTAARILQAWKRGDSPIATREELARANARWGVDLFVLHHGYAQMNDTSANYAVMMALAAEFVRRHAGLNLRSLTQEFYDRSWLDINERFGFLLRADYIDHPSTAALPPTKRPFLGGVLRSEVLAQGRGDFITNALFARFPAPRLGLDASQRQLLRAALEAQHADDIDEHLAWDELSGRIARIESTFTEANGAEPRERVLAWMRAHPEELQPYAMPDAAPSE